MGWGGGGLVLLFQSHTFGALLPIGNLYRQIGLRSIWQTFKVRLWKKTKSRSNIIEVFPSSVLSRRQSMTIFCATFTHLHLCCLKKSMTYEKSDHFHVGEVWWGLSGFSQAATTSTICNTTRWPRWSSSTQTLYPQYLLSKFQNAEMKNRESPSPPPSTPPLPPSHHC